MNSITEIIRILNSQNQKQNTIIVAIDGVGGAGKSTLANKLKDSLQDAVIIQMDDFYSPQLKRPDIVRLEKEVLQKLKTSFELQYRIYDWQNDKIIDGPMFKTKGIIIIEGIFSMDESIRDFYDVKIWIDCTQKIGSQRGIERDKKEYKIDTTEKWINHWMPLEKKYLETQNPSQYANIIV